MLEIIDTHAAVFACIAGLAAAAAAGVPLMLVRRARHRRRIMALGAADFHELAIMKRNAALKNDLSWAYSIIKVSVLSVTVDGRYRLLFSLDRWFRRHKELTREEFGDLFGKPLSERLRKEGFTVDYFPSGSVELKRHQGDPAIDIRWQSVDADPGEPETELPAKNGWN